MARNDASSAEAMSRDDAPDADPITLNDDTLRAWPLPRPDGAGDKEERGRTLIVAGSPELPGAALLAAMGALRAGAGKLMVAAPASVAPGLAMALPEARVVSLPQTPEGHLHDDAAAVLEGLAAKIDAMLIGPGLQDEDAAIRLAQRLLPAFANCAVVLDASAMGAIRAAPARRQPVLITPHAGEMAHLGVNDKESVKAEPQQVALSAARRWNAVLALKGPTTIIATPDGRLWRHESNVPGLAASGSGDVLAGLVVGLAARGAALEQAAAWAVALHAKAGIQLARRYGAIGYLARELPGEVPALMQSFAPA